MHTFPVLALEKMMAFTLVSWVTANITFLVVNHNHNHNHMLQIYNASKYHLKFEMRSIDITEKVVVKFGGSTCALCL